MSTKGRALQLNKGILCPLSELVNASVDGSLDSFDNLPRGGKPAPLLHFRPI